MKKQDVPAAQAWGLFLSSLRAVLTSALLERIWPYLYPHGRGLQGSGPPQNQQVTLMGTAGCAPTPAKWAWGGRGGRRCHHRLLSINPAGRFSTFIPGASSEPLNPKPGMALLPQKNKHLARYHISFWKVTHSHSSHPNGRQPRRLADGEEACFRVGEVHGPYF